MPEAKVQNRWIYYSVASGFLFAALIVIVKGLSSGDFGMAIVMIAFMGGLLGALFGMGAWGILQFFAANRFVRSRGILLKIYDAQREVQRGSYCSRCDEAFLKTENLSGSPEYLMNAVLLLHLDSDDLASLAKNRISW